MLRPLHRVQQPKYLLQPVWSELRPNEYRLLTFEEVLENAKEITEFLVYHHPTEFEIGMMDSTSKEEIASCKFLLYIDCNRAGIYTVDGYSCKVYVEFENGLNGIKFEPKPGNIDHGHLSEESRKEVQLIDDDYYLHTRGLLRSSIDAEIPEGYRLASFEELKSSYAYDRQFTAVVKKSKLQVDGNNEDLWLVLRKMGHLRQGEDRDIQDISRDIYFLYASQPDYEPRIRLKNGFIDMNRRLVWKEFSKHNIQYILGVNMKHKTELKIEDKVVALLFSCVLESYREIEELKEDEQFLKIMTQNNRNAPSSGSAIHLCAQEGLYECLEEMFAELSEDEINEACKAKADMDGETPLHLAVLKEDMEMVERLCTQDSINEKTKTKQWTPLMTVTEYQGQRSGLWKTLLACKGLNLSIENKVMSNVFHSLASGGSRPHASMLKEMLEKCGCKVSYEAYKAAVLAGQWQPRDLYVDMKIEEVAKLHNDNFKHTRNATSAINHPNKRGETPLHAFLNIRLLPTAADVNSDIDDDADVNSDDDDANVPDRPPPDIEFTVPIQFSALLISAGADIKAVDKQGQNALHKVCLLPEDMVQMCQILHEICSQWNKHGDSEWNKYVCSQNFYGENVLHIAAKSGNADIVNFLLNPSKSDENTVYKLIMMRDYNDNTIFHSLASSPQKFTVEDKKKLEIAKLIWNKAEKICKGGPKGELQFIIWSVEEDGRLADKLATENHYPELAHYLEDKRKNSKENLLGLALNFDNFDMALELINRDAVITKQMRKHAEIVELKIEDSKSKSIRGLPTLNKINELEAIMLSHRGRTTDQPTDEDLLERADINNSITALLLNQQMGSPITLGILGGTGMGKSSMMLQVEHNLLSRAALETLRLALPKNDRDSISETSFTGTKLQSSQLKRRANQILTELQHVIREIEYNKQDDKFDNEAIDLAKSNDPHSRTKSKWHSLLEHLRKLFKRIKSMIVSTFKCEVLPQEKMKEKIDSYITTFNEDNKWVAKRLALVSHGEEVHALMTVRFDAWQYEIKDEAWAGMAIEIIKEIENSMSKAQLLYASLMYNSKKRNESYARIYWVIGAYLVVGWIAAFIFYTLFALVNIPYGKAFQFGSTALSFLGCAWAALRRITQYAKPISDTLMERTKSMQMEHLSKVGYQHQVIEDINFLKSLMTYRDIPKRPLYKFLACILNIQSRSAFFASPVEASDALKHIPQHRHHFRIIMFIDNLDRDKEQLFTPINMILKSCDINAVVAIDTKAVGEVSARKQELNVAVDQVFQIEQEQNVADEQIKKDTLLTQLIQIPIVLPEPDVHELNNVFLKKHLKDMQKKKKSPKKKPDPSPPSGGQNQSAVDQHNAKITSSDIIMETRGNPSLHKVTRLSVEISPTIDSLPMEYTMVENGQSSQEISIETEERPSHSIERSPTNDNLPREYEMVMRKSIHRAQPGEETEETQKERQKVLRDVKLNVLDSNYSRGEIDIFKILSKHTSGYYRSPRAWKSLLNYHRLIRSLLTYDQDNFKGKAWKRQLVIWLFFCWQWKKQMDEIFQRWEALTCYTLADIDNDSLIAEINDRRKLKKVLKDDYPLNLLKKKRYRLLWESVNNIYPTLSEIVSSAQNPEGSTQNENMKEGNSQNLEGSTQNENMTKTSSQIWNRLSNALTHGDVDVSMQCMLVFQKYRFDCKPGVLKLYHR